MILFELYSLNICVNHKRFIKIWIYDIFNKYNVLYDYQFKFHKLYSIHIALITSIDKLLNALDDGSKVVGMFPDFSQAFDWHNWSWYFAT